MLELIGLSDAVSPIGIMFTRFFLGASVHSFDLFVSFQSLLLMEEYITIECYEKRGSGFNI